MKNWKSCYIRTEWNDFFFFTANFESQADKYEMLNSSREKKPTTWQWIEISRT